MTRALQETLQTNLSATATKVVDLVKITAFDGGRLLNAQTLTNIDSDLFFTNNDYDLIFDSTTYKANFGFIGHSGLQESSKAVNDQFELTFTGIDPVLTANILNSKFVGALVQLRKAVIIGSGDNLDTHVDSVGNSERVYLVYDGFVSSFTYRLSKEAGTLSLICGGPFAAFERKSLYGFTSNSSHQSKYTGDTSMEYANISINGIKWGPV